MAVRKYANGDLDAMIAIWNEVVEAGDAFPQEGRHLRRHLSVFQGDVKTVRVITFLKKDGK